jgi:hypothetical protein
MGGKKKKAPATPDYAALQKTQYEKELAEQQRVFDANLKQAQDKTWADRATQITPEGTLSWVQDPATGQWTQKTEYSPEIQAMRDRQLALQAQGFGLQEEQMKQLQGLISRGQFQGPEITAKYDQGFADRYAQQFTENLTGRLQPIHQQANDAMDVQLRLKGLQPGTEAFDRAKRNLLTSQGDVISQANLQGQLAGQGEARSSFDTELRSQQAMYDKALKEYLLPWETYQSTQGITGGLSGPTFSNYNQASGATMGQAAVPDIVAAAQQQYAQQMQQYNEAQSKKGGKGQMIGSLAGGALGMMAGPMGAYAGAQLGGAVGGSFSDPALKDEIAVISDEDAYNAMLKIQPHSWAWPSGRRATGIMAPEVLEHFPHLGSQEGGYLKVDYEAFTGLLLGAFRHLAKLENENARHVR